MGWAGFGVCVGLGLVSLAVTFGFARELDRARNDALEAALTVVSVRVHAAQAMVQRDDALYQRDYAIALMSGRSEPEASAYAERQRQQRDTAPDFQMWDAEMRNGGAADDRQH